MGSPRLKPITLTDAERDELEALASRRQTAQGLAERARIVLAASEGGSCPQIGARLGVHRITVRKWWHRYAEYRLEGLPAGGTHWSSHRALLPAQSRQHVG